MTHTTYRVQLGARVYQTTDSYAATQASRRGARVTACTSGRADQ